MSSNDIIVVLRALGQASFQAAMGQSAASVTAVGTAASGASTQTTAAGSAAAATAGNWKTHAKAIAGATLAMGGMAAGVSFVKTATNAAVDLGEQVNKTSVVFRGSEKPLINWSKTTASSLGIARSEALEAAGTFGNMLVPMGFARKDAAAMSQRMVTLSADMASFNNADPSDTLEALRAGLAGESEPLRKFGVFLSDARLKQEALSMGIYKGKGPLDAAAKAQATYALILKDTKDAQGDFGRTSGSLANQQRILKAQYTNLAATVGKAVVPVATKLALALSWLLKHTEVLIPVLALLTGAFVAYAVAQTAAAIAALSFNAAFLLIPLAIAAVVAAIIVAYKKVDWFRNAIDWLWSKIKALANWLKSNWKTVIIAALTGPFGIAYILIRKNWDRIKDYARSVVGWFKGLGKSLITAIGDGIKSAGSLLLDALRFVIDKLPIPGILKGKLKDVLHFGTGGATYGSGGVAVVGERGPELVRLPGGSRITPLSTAGALVPALGGASAAGRQTVVYVQLDRRTIATAVAQDTADQQARR